MFFTELQKRNLIDYFDYMELYDYHLSLNSCDEIIEFLDKFENTFNFSLSKEIKEVIDYLIINSSKEFIDHVYNMPQEEVIMFHFGLGVFIRNEFGINDNSNVKLLDELKKSKFNHGAVFADDYSHVLLLEFWDYVHQNYDDIIRNTKFKNEITL